MTRIESSILVFRTVDEVFAFLNQRESHLHFIPRMTSLDQTTPGDFGQAGTRLSGALNYFGIRIPVKYEILDANPNETISMNGQMGPFNFEDGYILSSTGSGTQIRFWLDLQPTGWTRVFSPFMSLIGRIHAWETLRNLKRELTKEQTASSSSHSSSQRY